MSSEFNEIFSKLLNGEVDSPDELSKYIIQLSAHLYNLGENTTKAEIAFAALWNKERVNYKTDKSCEIALKSSNEWLALEQAKNAYRMTKELVIAARKRLTILSDLGRNNY